MREHAAFHLMNAPHANARGGSVAARATILLTFPFSSPTIEKEGGTTSMAVTKRQKQVLDFVSHFIEDNGYSPSYEEIARGLNLASLATVHKHISTLETKQYLKRGFNQSRSLDLGPKYIQEQRKHRQDISLEVPLLGRIAAGAPVEAVEQRETVRFGDFLGNPDVFALEVRGDSMIEDHICSGDLVLVEKASQAKDGDIVVALIEGSQTTLKRFYKEPGDKVRLQPANSSLQPIFVAGKDLAIQGRLLAVLRKYK
jgi:repressor LexA